MRARYWVLIAIAAGLTGAAPAWAASDTWITMKSKMALIEADNVDALEINVDTIQGVVTLHGKVDSEAEKAGAEKAVAKLDGVVRVRNLLQVVSESKEEAVEKSDERIADEIKEALSRTAFHSDTKIEAASVNNGVVLLKGKAQTMNDHLRAMEIAQQIPGVRQVASEIASPDTVSDADLWPVSPTLVGGTAAPPGGAAISGTSDLGTTAEVKMQLMSDERVSATEINVDTRYGVVTLFGYVDSDSAKAAAEEIAAKVSSVQRVDNALEVLPETEREAVGARDEDIDREVGHALRADKLLKDDIIDVEVKNGIARLTGTVDSEGERYAAAWTARAVKGVQAIKNDLTVKGAQASN
jgi:hyperosmotically inducible periplasmic protein